MGRILPKFWTRRSAICGLTAGTGGLLAGLSWEGHATEPVPETTRIRLLVDPSLPVLCWAPQYLALDLLRMEGFERIEMVPFSKGSSDASMLAENLVDLTFPLAMDVAVAVDRGARLTVLGGLHAGCIEIFAGDRVPSLNHLKGARLAATDVNGDAHSFLSSVLSYVGLDPEHDVEWVFEPDWSKWPRMLEDGDIDVLRMFPPVTYDIQEKEIGNVILNTTIDAPWRNFYCCMIAARSEFVRDHPIATKRALRAIAKAQDLCAADPEGSAGTLLQLGATGRQDYAERVLSEIRYGEWRDFDPGASIRFYALKLREAGMIQTSPAELLRQCTDFSFLEEIKREIRT